MIDPLTVLAFATAKAKAAASFIGLSAAKAAPLLLSVFMLRRFAPKPQSSSPDYYRQFLAQAQENQRDRQFRLRMQQEELSRRIEEREWPARMSPARFGALGLQTRPQPLVVMFIPPDIEDSSLGNEVTDLFERRLREIVNLAYPRAHPQRPVELLAGRGWRKGAPRGEVALHNLYHLAPHVPTAIIQLDRVGNNLHLLVGQYGCGAADEAIPPMAFQSLSADVQARVAELVREEGPLLHALAGAGIDLAQLGSGHMLNLALLDAEARGERIPSAYFQATREHFLQAVDIVGPALKLLVAGMADQFHLRRHGAVPQLPRLLPAIAAGIPSEIAQALTEQVLNDYEATYLEMSRRYGPREADLLLELAAGLAADAPENPGLQNLAHAGMVLDRAIRRLLTERSMPPETSLLQFAGSAARGKDLPFLWKVASVWERLGQGEEAAQLRTLCVILTERAKSEPPEPTPDPFLEAIKGMMRPDSAER
jgi:hypothetical protein